MSAEPEKFHVGMIDFFSIILPGAVMTFYLRTAAERSVMPAVFPAPKSEVEGWVIFAVASYILGHFLFLSGSWLDKGYDALRETFYPNGKNVPLLTALKIKKANPTLEHLDDEAINTFQWAKCRLALAYPAALAHVQRFEADSKFFRSLFVVLLILFVSFSISLHVWFAIACLLMAGAALWRYGEQRFKSTRQAYWYIIALESIRSDSLTATIKNKESEDKEADRKC
jgi:hypothetical protein